LPEQQTCWTLKKVYFVKIKNIFFKKSDVLIVLKTQKTGKIMKHGGRLKIKIMLCSSLWFYIATEIN